MTLPVFAQEITCLAVQYLKYSTVSAIEEMTNHGTNVCICPTYLYALLQN